MDKKLFIETLNKGTHKLKLRKLLIASCLKNPSYIPILLKNIQQVDDKNSTFSTRILELACKENLAIIIPYLDEFCKTLKLLKQEASIRACAKICELLMVANFTNHDKTYIASINHSHQEKIIETGFDWMISNQPTAIQAYTMHSLYLLGLKHDWIHPELVLILERAIPTGSIGLVNRARKIIKAIQAKKMFKL